MRLSIARIDFAKDGNQPESTRGPEAATELTNLRGRGSAAKALAAGGLGGRRCESTRQKIALRNARHCVGKQERPSGLRNRRVAAKPWPRERGAPCVQASCSDAV